MKELSLEEKAKRYDTALDKIADAVEAGTIEQGLAKWLFPELCDNEDEKIRDEIVLYIGAKDDISLDTHNKWLSWLEKQSKENMVEALRLEYEKGKFDALQEQRKEWTSEDLWNRNEIMDILKEYNRDDLINWLEKQEQKSTTQHKFNIGDTIKYVGDREEFTREEHKIKEVLNDCYLTTRGTYLPFKFEDYYILAEQNPTWSAEDEKIRKNIKIALMSMENELRDFYYTHLTSQKELIAWLEKQGKQPCNVSPIDNFTTEFEKQVSYLIASSINKENNYTADYVKWTANSLLNYAKKEIDKWYNSEASKEFENQGEPKSNGVDILSDKQLFKHLEKQETSYTKKDVDDAYVEGMAFVKNEIEKQYEANYQIRKDIATFIFNYRGDIKDRAKWMDYLGIKISFVEEQGEQKLFNLESIREDWSEEDEHRINDTIYFLETAKKHYASTVELDACINWLKSLKDRYSWTPSYAQMEALWCATEMYLESDNDNVVKLRGKVLESLYDELKKLNKE